MTVGAVCQRIGQLGLGRGRAATGATAAATATSAATASAAATSAAAATHRRHRSVHRRCLLRVSHRPPLRRLPAPPPPPAATAEAQSDGDLLRPGRVGHDFLKIFVGPSVYGLATQTSAAHRASPATKRKSVRIAASFFMVEV